MDRNSDLPEIRITDADTTPSENQNPDNRPNQDQVVETKPQTGSTDPQGTDGAYEKNTEAKPINIPKPLKPFGVWPRVHFPAEDQYHSSSSSSSDAMTQAKQRAAFAKAIASGEINHGKLRFFCDVCQLNLSRATHLPIFSVFQNFDEREKYRRDIFGKESILPRERSDHREVYEALDAMNSSPLLWWNEVPVLPNHTWVLADRSLYGHWSCRRDYIVFIKYIPKSEESLSENQ